LSGGERSPECAVEGSTHHPPPVHLTVGQEQAAPEELEDADEDEDRREHREVDDHLAALQHALAIFVLGRFVEMPLDPDDSLDKALLLAVPIFLDCLESPRRLQLLGGLPVEVDCEQLLIDRRSQAELLPSSRVKPCPRLLVVSPVPVEFAFRVAQRNESVALRESVCFCLGFRGSQLRGQLTDRLRQALVGTAAGPMPTGLVGMRSRVVPPGAHG
jgi:hypothetical protein